MSKFFKHLHTVNKHRFLTFVHCAKAGIFWLGLVHDLSKYSLTEFIPGVKYYTGNKSPQEKERSLLGYSKAWMHHKGRNKHHFEYWTDFNASINQYVPVRMPIKYLKEMFCDRVSASKTYLKEKYTNSSALEYFNSKKSSDKMHHDTAVLLYEMLLYLSTHTEEETFKYIRSIKDYEEK